MCLYDAYDLYCACRGLEVYKWSLVALDKVIILAIFVVCQQTGGLREPRAIYLTKTTFLYVEYCRLAVKTVWFITFFTGPLLCLHNGYLGSPFHYYPIMEYLWYHCWLMETYFTSLHSKLKIWRDMSLVSRSNKIGLVTITPMWSLTMLAITKAKEKM